MAQKQINQSIAFDLVFRAARGESAAIKSLEKIHATATKTGFGKGITEGAKKVEEQFGEAVQKAMSIGADGFHKTIKEDIKKYGDALTQAASKIKDLDAKMKAEKDLEKKKALGLERKAVNDQIKDLMRAQRTRLNQMDKALERQVEAFKAGAQIAGKDFQERAAGAGEGFASLVGKGLGSVDVTDLASNITSAVGGGLKNLTSLAAYKSGKMAEKGDTGGLQKALSIFSRGALVIAGATAAVAGLVAVFGAAYGQTKDFNKAIMEGTSAIDLMGDSAFNVSSKLSTSLEAVRRASLDVAYETRQTSEEVIKMLTSFNSAGVTFKEMKGLVKEGATEIESYAEMARFATRNSLSLGVSVDEVAKTVNEMTRDMGMGLDQIEDGFGLIFASAGKAGMNVRDFFTSVNEATSGMALYNIRLEDTISLMLGLTKTMGEQRAKELMTQKGAFKDATTLDKAKTVMTAGGAAKGIIAGQADKQMQAFSENMTSGMLEKLKGTKADQMLTNGQLDEEKIAKLSSAQYGEIANALSDVLGPQGTALGGQLSSLVKVTKAKSTGNMFDITDAMGKMDQMGDMAMKMVQANALVGNRTMGEMKGLSRAAYEQVTGISGEAFDTFAELQAKVAARIAADTGRETSSVTGDEVARALSGPDAAKYLGAEDREKMQELQNKAVPAMERIAQQQLTETISVSATLKNIIADLLEKANRWLESIAKFVGGDKQENLVKAMEALEYNLVATKEKQSDEAAYLQNLKKAVSEEKDPARKAEKEEMLAKMEAALKETEKEYKRIKVSLDAARRGESMGDARFKVDTGMDTKEAYESLAKDIGDPGQADWSRTPEQEENAKKLLELTEAQSEAEKGDPKKLAALVKEAQEKKKKDAENTKAAEDAWALIEETMKAGTDKIAEEIQISNEIASAEKDAVLGPLIRNVKDEKPGAKSALMRELRKGSLSDSDKRIIKGLHLQDPSVSKKHEDFIFRGNASGGNITPINHRDEFLGMKPNGPVDQALASRRGGGMVNIHINGGDESRVYAVVKKALVDSGIRPPVSGD